MYQNASTSLCGFATVLLSRQNDLYLLLVTDCFKFCHENSEMIMHFFKRSGEDNNDVEIVVLLFNGNKYYERQEKRDKPHVVPALIAGTNYFQRTS